MQEVIANFPSFGNILWSSALTTLGNRQYFNFSPERGEMLREIVSFKWVFMK